MTACHAAAGRAARRRYLLSGVSVAALLAATLLPVAADARSSQPLSRQWLNQRSGQTGGQAAVPSGVVVPKSGISANQAAQVQRAMTNMSRASATMRAQVAGQSPARAAALALNPTIPNGLVNGGLDPSDPTSWINAKLGTPESRNGTEEITVDQSASKAILTWKTFNIGADTTLTFDQKGHRDWVALNRVENNLKPSYILGKISAEGSVYIINRNGIVFGGTSQVNLGGLIASSLDIGLPYRTLQQRNAYFLGAANSGTTDGTLSFSFNLKMDADGKLQGSKIYDGSLSKDITSTHSFVPEADAVEGGVEVQAGAVIRTRPLSQDDQYLGRVVLAAPQVSNAGTIETPDGQTILVGARNFTLLANDQQGIKRAKEDANNSTVRFFIDLTYDADLRGAQIFTGLSDYFTAGGDESFNKKDEVQDILRTLVPDERCQYVNIGAPRHLDRQGSQRRLSGEPGRTVRAGQRKSQQAVLLAHPLVVRHQ